MGIGRGAAVSIVAVLAFCGCVSPARAGGSGRRERAEAVFEDGVRQYSAGRFDAARELFERTLRLDPGHRVARVSLERIRVEHPIRESELPTPAGPPRATARDLRRAAEDAPFAALARAYFFERTLGDARSDQGGLRAMLGRIDQLAAERRFCRARGRRYARRAELLELARRLPTVSC